MSFKLQRTTWPTCLVCKLKAPQGPYLLDPRDPSKGKGPHLELWGKVIVPMEGNFKEEFDICPNHIAKLVQHFSHVQKTAMDRLDVMIVRGTAATRGALRESHGDALVDGVIVRKGITICKVCGENRNGCGHCVGGVAL